MRTVWASWAGRLGVWMLCASGLIAIGATSGGESPGPGKRQRAAEPLRRPGVEQQALVAASEGRPFKDVPVSPAIARTIEMLRTRPAPPDEVYALITVTDRKTGEQRVMTRGTPRSEYAIALDCVDGQPPEPALKATEPPSIGLQDASVRPAGSRVRWRCV